MAEIVSIVGRNLLQPKIAASSYFEFYNKEIHVIDVCFVEKIVIVSVNYLEKTNHLCFIN